LEVDAPPVRVSAESAARIHLSRHADLLGLPESVVGSAVMTDSHALAGGAGIYRFAQRVNGIEVFRSRASVVVDGSNRLVSIANALTSATPRGGAGKTPTFATGPEAALARASTRHAGTLVDEHAVRDIGPVGEDGRSYAVTTPVGSMRILDATAKRVLYPEGGEIVPAYYVELLGRASGSNLNQARAYVIGAKDGRVFYDVSLTHNDVFTYRVFADPAGNHIPTDGPFVDYSPHPTGTPNNARPAYQMPVLIMMEGFNKNPAGAADPWLAPTDTYTFGNNVRAYSDRNDFVDDAGSHHNDGYDDGVDIRADVTAAKTFDRVYDTASAPNVSTNQIKAAITQIFY